MPWCETCDKWKSPGGVMPDGTCPKCGNPVDHGAVAVEAQETAETHAAARVEAAKIPWHFWLMVVAAALYLGWRAVQGILALF